MELVRKRPPASELLTLGDFTFTCQRVSLHSTLDGSTYYVTEIIAKHKEITMTSDVSVASKLFDSTVKRVLRDTISGSVILYGKYNAKLANGSVRNTKVESHA